MRKKVKGSTILKSSNKDNVPEKRATRKSPRVAAKRKRIPDNCENQVTKKPRTRSSIIQTLVREASKKIGYSKRKRKTTEPEVDLQSDCEKSEVIFSHISATNWNKFEDAILKRNIDKETKLLNTCKNKMQFKEYTFHYTGFRVLQTVIVEALLNRKWDNLLELTVLLGQSYFIPVYRMFYRNLCQILKYYHPAIRGTEYADQIDLIVEKHSRKNKDNNDSLII